MDIPQKTSPRDVFLYLFSIVAMGASAVAFGTLLFQYINIYFPDPLTDSFRLASSYLSPIRWSIASLIVIFPLYVWVLRFLQKDWTAHPEKRDLRIRKWLVYLTLFVAALVIVGDLVALIFNFLEGELTARFALKVASIFFIAGSVFMYYLWNLRHEEAALRHPRMRIFVWAIIVIVIAGVVTGFFVAGSPMSQRAVRFDERRTGDLQNIQWHIVNYWQRTQTLPQNLAALRDDISGFSAPRDPRTGESYEYRILAVRTFELCATFETDSDDISSVLPKGSLRAPASPFGESVGFGSFSHGTGRMCFERTIDPQLYPPITGQPVR